MGSDYLFFHFCNVLDAVLRAQFSCLFVFCISVNICKNMFEWMMHLYCALCIVVHPKRFTIMWGGLSWTTTSVQHPLGWCDGCHRTTAPVRSPHTSYRWRGERVIEPIKWMGIIRGPWLTRASGGNLARTPGLHPTLYEKCRGIFNDHRESGRLIRKTVMFNMWSKMWIHELKVRMLFVNFENGRICEITLNWVK